MKVMRVSVRDRSLLTGRGLRNSFNMGQCRFIHTKRGRKKFPCLPSRRGGGGEGGGGGGGVTEGFTLSQRGGGGGHKENSDLSFSLL